MQGWADDKDRMETFLSFYKNGGCSGANLRKRLKELLPVECEKMTADEARDYCLKALGREITK